MAGVVAGTARLMRSVGRGGCVGDHDCGGLTIAESDGGSFSGVRTRTLGRCRRHASVDGLSDSDDSGRRAIHGLVDVDRGGGRASTFDRSGLRRLAGVGHSSRVDWRAGRGNASDAVGHGRDVRGQDVSDGERGAVVGRSAVCVDWRAAGYERSQGLGHWESAGRVDDRGRSARNVRGRRLGWGTSVLARSDGDDAGSKASLSLGSRSVSDRACGECGVSCSSLRSRVVLRWCGVASRMRLATCRVHTTTLVRRLAACGVDTTAWVRRLAVRLAVRCGWVDRRLAVRLAVRRSRVNRGLAPDRAG